MEKRKEMQKNVVEKETTMDGKEIRLKI